MKRFPYSYSFIHSNFFSNWPYISGVFWGNKAINVKVGVSIRLIMFQSNRTRLIFVPVCTCVVHKRCHLSVVTTCLGMRDTVLTDDVSEQSYCI